MVDLLRSRRRRRDLLLLALIAGALVASPSGRSAVAGDVPLVRVAVVRDAEEVALSAPSGFWIGLHRSSLRPTRASGAWTVRATPEGLEVRDHASCARGQVVDTLFVSPIDPETGPVAVNGISYRGELLIWRGSGGVRVINVIDLESYLRGVVPLEMGPQPPEKRAALEAQAVAARSYTLATMGRWRRDGFDLVSTVEDQAYGGVPTEKPACSDAIDATRGVVAAFGGKPIRAFYCSTCGGSTASAEDVWRHDPVGYLEPVVDRASGAAADNCAASPRHAWHETWSLSEFESVLDDHLPRIRPEWERSRAGRLRDVRLEARFACGRAARLVLEFERASVELAGDEIRWVLRRPGGKEGLRSARIAEVTLERRTDRVEIRGQGFGHGVGMCQYGAMGMAASGHDYGSILTFYYRDIALDRRY